MERTLDAIDAVVSQIVDGAVQVHKKVGPGILESAYHLCLLFELQLRGLQVRSNVKLPLLYRGQRIKSGFRIDLLVEEMVIVELKAVPKLLPIHEAQLLTYLRLSGLRVGLLLNFHAPLMKDGIKRMINGW